LHMFVLLTRASLYASFFLLKLPYWDWSLESDTWTSSPAWERLGGSKSNEVLSGKYWKGWTVSLPRKFSVRRQFTVGQDVFDERLESRENLDAVVQMGGSISFQQFASYVLLLSYPISDSGHTLYNSAFREQTLGLTREFILPTFIDRYLEAVHGGPHIAIGGIMGDGMYSPGDPAFFLHHGFVDKIYADWQRQGGGNTFGGLHRGETTRTSEMMSEERWRRTVKTILTDLTPCVVYRSPSRGLPKIDISGKELLTERIEAANIARHEGAGLPNSTALTPIKFSSLPEKRECQADAVASKILSPKLYKRRVLHSAVEELFLKNAARLFSKLPEANLEVFCQTRRTVVAKVGRLLPKDLREPVKTVKMTNEQIVLEGKREQIALQSGKRLPGDVDDTDVEEEEANTGGCARERTST
jgi:Common central domain of tyrosinase